MSGAVGGNKNADAFVRWGVPPGPALWPIVLNILFVIDGRINTSQKPGSFGLGYVLQTLRDDSFAWWVRFHVQVVRRDEREYVDVPLSEDWNYNPPGETPVFQAFGFRFTEPNFNLDDWDQVWFFGDYPMNNFSDDFRLAKYSPLENDELQKLAAWMDRGGAVFAAGDHWNLGSSMCSRIPRVRTMRRWTAEQGVPPRDGDTRHQTLQPNPNCKPGPACDDKREGDEFPQPVELVYRQWTDSILVRPPFPHPLLSTPSGVIDRFPDHMHEGEVVDDNSVALDKALDIPGYERPEYPFAEPQIDPGTAASIVSGATPPRPHPHVAAYGRTTNLFNPQNAPLERVAGGITPPLLTKRFGLVGAYDGDSVGIGRVVVDSTWHHWFSLNLHGFAANNLPVYEHMQAYYRNVGLWLATPAQRQAMLFALTWGPVVSDPMAFPQSSASLWSVGERAIQVISRTVAPSMLFDFAGSFFRGRAEEIFGVPHDVDPADPYTASVPTDLAVRAIVGGIASALITPAAEYIQAEGKPRRLLDPGAIARRAAEGVRQGHLALIHTMRSSAAASTTNASRLEDAFQPAVQGPIPVELVSLRVVAERLQLPDPADPALADSYGARRHSRAPHFTATIRVAFAGSVVAHAVLQETEVPSFQPAGAFVDLDRVLYEGLAQSGESLTVEVVTGAAALEPVAAERVRFTETIAGDPSSWVGPHAPNRSQSWRLWYRVERIRDTGETPKPRGSPKTGSPKTGQRKR